VVGSVHGEWRSGEGIAGTAARGSGDTPERALAQADLATAGKPCWLATPASHRPPRRLPHCAGTPHLARERVGVGVAVRRRFCAKPRKWG
jgi:hypothetical protein